LSGKKEKAARRAAGINLKAVRAQEQEARDKEMAELRAAYEARERVLEVEGRSPRNRPLPVLAIAAIMAGGGLR